MEIVKKKKKKIIIIIIITKLAFEIDRWPGGLLVARSLVFTSRRLDLNISNDLFDLI